jgi:hypothetical protein
MTRLLVVALMSMTLIALELVWTRIFSAEFFYTYAFLTLSFAILGLGLGGLALRLFAFLNHEAMIGLALALAGMTALAGPPLVFQLGLELAQLHTSWAMVGKFTLTLMLLSAPFFLGGMALAGLFKRSPGDIPRLYMADLMGAGCGIAGAVFLMNWLGTPTAVFWVSLPILVAALLVSKRGWRLAPAILMAAVILLSGRAGALLEVKRQERAPVIYKHWDAMAKIKVFDYGGRYRGLNIDNVANTSLVPFEGDWEAAYADTTPSSWAINVEYLVAMFDSCTFLSLGAGGGVDVLQALDHQAAEVHAVEVIPHINRMMLHGDPDGYLVRDSTVSDSLGRLITTPEYTGRIYHDPRVRVVTEDARTYVRRQKNTFDIIFSLSSNTWAALGSGSFALAENYLFTKEAFEDYWRALTDGGFLSMEHQVYMPRLVSDVILALEELGVNEPRDHFAVYNLPLHRRNLLLLSKRPLTDEIRTSVYGGVTPARQDTIHLLYPAPDSLADNLINRIVTDGWQAHAQSAAIDISPTTDNRPFVAQLGMWKNLTRANLQEIDQYAEFSGFPLSKLTMAIILLVIVVLIIPLNVLPYLRQGPKLGPVPWLYFFAIGTAFMAIEVVLIQRYTLFIGASVYSIATILLTLLVAAGVGSRFSARVGDATAFGGIIVLLLLEVLVYRSVTGVLPTLPMLARVLVCSMLVFPLGFFMGMPFPKAVLRVGELVDWGFAVNGAASVFGATAVLMVAISYGFTVALLGSAAVYLLAFWLLTLRDRWVVVGWSEWRPRWAPQVSRIEGMSDRGGECDNSHGHGLDER